MQTWHLGSLDVGGDDDADLRSWSAALGDARVIGLGEATHGSAEFFTLKHRLVAHLVAERGTRVVAFEASEAAATRVDRWIAGADDDGRAALGGLGFWVWDTVEVLALVTALRGINATRGDADRVRFVGVDPQLPDCSVAAVSAFLRDLGRGDLARALAPLAGRRRPGRAEPPELAASVYRALTVVRAAAPPRDVVTAAARVARTAVWVTTPRDDPAASYAARDRLMAEAVLALVDDAGGPVVLWAHNGHVRRCADPVASAGEHLRRALGDAYRPVGLLAVDGTFRARRSRGPFLPPTRRPGSHRLGGAPGTTLEGRLAAEHDGDLLVDLRDAAPAWCREASWTRSHGATAPMFPTVAFTPVVPAADFDGLALVRHTTPSMPLG